jgi:hypothetical protein
MQVLHFQKNKAHSLMGGYYVHKEATSDNQLNDKHTIFPNTILDTVLKNENL